MNGSRRIVYGTGQPGGHRLLPEVLEAGWGKFDTADRGHLRPHGHAGAFELCLLTSGEVEWCAEEAPYVLRAGDVFVTQPDELHGGRDGTMHPCSLYWLIVGSPSCGVPWPFIESALADQVHARLRRLRKHRLRATERVIETFRDLFDLHRLEEAAPSEMLLRRGEARVALHRLLLQLVRIGDAAASDLLPSAEPALPQGLGQAIELLRRSACEPRALQKVCRAHGGYQQLNRRCLESLGTSLPQFWLRERVRLARERLLDPSATVTDVATELGFSSSQHFATVFRRYTGFTPRSYRLRFEEPAASSVEQDREVRPLLQPDRTTDRR